MERQGLIQNDDDYFYEKIFRKSHSRKSMTLAKFAVKSFNEFCTNTFGKSLNEVINEVKSDRLDQYKLLDNFVGFLDRNGKTPGTIQTYTAYAKKYLRFHGVKIYNEDFKQEVSLPTKFKFHDDPITRETIARILNACNPRFKTLLLVLCSSGMRIGEALSLRVRDIDFDSTPTRIMIRPMVTKTSEARETFITEEATIAMKDFLGYRMNRLDSFVFGDYDDAVQAANNASASFRKMLRKLPDLNLKIDEHTRFRIHLHSFRKFFYSTVAPIVGSDIAHALMGHSEYLDTYFKKTREERSELYQQVEPHLTVGNADVLLKEVKYTQKEIKTMKEKMERIEGVESDMVELVTELVRNGKLTPKDMKGRFPSLQKHVIAVQEDFLD
ncbi:MAG: tyrosine-type recombinase/integrase [Nitrososphaerales archaeon]